MATHSSVLAWRIPGTGEPGGLPSIGSHRVGHDWGDLAAAAIARKGEMKLKFQEMVHLFIQPFSSNWTCTVHQKLLDAAAAAKSRQSCPTLCDPIDGSLIGSSVLGILQARTLEWVAISFSNACKWKVKGKSLSRVRLLATPWTVAYQAPPSMGFSRQEYWSGVPLPSLRQMLLLK